MSIRDRCKPLFHRNIVVKVRQLFLTDDVVLIQPLNDFSLANLKQDAFRIQFGSINKICRSVSSSIVGIELQAAILICRVLRISNSSRISICTVDNLNICLVYTSDLYKRQVQFRRSVFYISPSAIGLRILSTANIVCTATRIPCMPRQTPFQ